MKDHIDEPFPGPRPYTAAEEHLFHGRDEEIDDLRDLICTYSVVLLFSQSGAGKSSLLEAGLRSRLQPNIGSLTKARVGFISQSVEVDSRRNIYVESVIRSAFPNLTGINSLKECLVGRNTPKHLVVFDQFEELFTCFPDRWDQRRDFLAQIGEAVQLDPDLRILFVMREEYLGQLEAYSDLFPLNLQIRYRLERLKEEAAIDAIEKPLKTFGVQVQRNAVVRLIDNLRLIRVRTSGQIRTVKGEFVEPVHLQVVCRDLWRQAPKPSNEFIIPEELGNVDIALQRFYDLAVRRAATQSESSEGKVRHWFEYKVITSSGTRRVLFKEERATEGLPNTAVNSLEDEHIIRSEPRATEQTCELTHDRLIGPIKHSNAIFFRRRRRFLWPAYAGLVAVAILGIVAVAKGYTSRRLAEASQKELAAEDEESRAGVSDLRYGERLLLYPGDNWSSAWASARQHFRDSLEHFNRAITLDEELKDKAGNGDDIVLSLATLSRKEVPFQNQIEKILSEAQRKQWNQTTTAYVLMALGEIYYDKGNTNAAGQIYSQINEPSMSSGDIARLHEDEGLILLRQGKYEDAKWMFRRAIGDLRSDDAGGRLRIMLDLGKVANAQGDYRQAEKLLNYADLSQIFRAYWHVKDPPWLLREISLAATREIPHRYAYARKRLDEAAKDQDPEQHALVYLSYVRLDIESGYKETNTDIDLVKQAVEDLAKISPAEDPYNPEALARTQSYAARIHSFQAIIHKHTSSPRDKKCWSQDGSQELQCAKAELSQSDSFWNFGDFKLEQAFNAETRGLIDLADNNRNSAVRDFSLATCIYRQIGIEKAMASVHLGPTAVENAASPLRSNAAQLPCP